MRALYRSTAGEPWQEVDVIGRHWPSGALIVREVGKLFNGVMLLFRDQLRVEA